MKKLILASLMMSVGVTSFSVSASSKPRASSVDQHIKSVQFDPNNVVELAGKYGYQTQVMFAPGEVIQSVSLGDSMAWQAVPVSNNLFIKPVTSSKTNMTVLTNKYSYNFQLDSETQTDTPTYKLQFTYPNIGFSSHGASGSVGTFDPDKINWKYSFTGIDDLAPDTVFDNGQFTYLKFDLEQYGRLPSIFLVDESRHETLVNYHMQGNYMVVNAVAKEFNLRDGDKLTTVYNDFAIGDWKKV